jgi:metal-responsive CopG/Arc/MetJ family transcriptional regulator
MSFDIILYCNTNCSYKKDGNMGRTAKLTVSLPRELIRETDRIAKQKKISRSKVISACLEDLVKKQKAAEMAEGYINMAKEQKQYIDMASRILPEVLPEWK